MTGAFVVWGVTNFTFNNNAPNMMQTGNWSTERVSMNRNIDAHFIEEMIPHHESAISMSKLALQRATHQELKDLAQNIINSQSKEIDQMKAWYKEWFGKDVSVESDNETHGMMGGQMGMGMMDDDVDLSNLANSTDFDKRFIEEMIPHHQMAIMMASMLKTSTERDEMRQLAENIISTQSKEIGQMREWYSGWGY